MKRTGLLLAAACWLVPSLGLAASGNDSHKVYRWVDDQGVVHFGDSVPAEYAQQDRKILNSQGIPVGAEEGAVTPAEREAAAAAEAEAAEARAEEAAERERDKVLLNTYLSVSEIERLRDQRQELLDGQIQLTELYLDSLRTKLGKLQRDAARFRPYSDDPDAPPIHENLARELSDTLDSIISYEKSLVDAQTTREKVGEKFAADIDRFKELKGLE